MVIKTKKNVYFNTKVYIPNKGRHISRQKIQNIKF